MDVLPPWFPARFLPYVGLEEDDYDGVSEQWKAGVPIGNLERRKALLAMIAVMEKNKVVQWRKEYPEEAVEKFEMWQVRMECAWRRS